MQDENTGTPPGEAEETSTPNEQGEGNGERSIASIQAEMYRKTEKMNEQLQATNRQLEQLTQILTAQRSAPAQPANTELTDDQLEELSISNPKAYARAIEDRAVRKANAVVDERLSVQTRTQNELARLVSDYPELSDQNSELTKKAGEYYNQLPAHLRNDPIAYKAAIRDAAADLGVLPKSKRRSNSNDADSFSFGGQGNGSGTGSGSRRGKQEPEVDPKTVAFSQLLGRDVKDPKVIEGLKKASQRKYGKYE